MKRFKFVMASATILAGLICALVPGARADDEQAISKLERRLAVTTNLDEAMKYWESGDDVVLFDAVPPREFAGHEAIHEDLVPFPGIRMSKSISSN